MTDLARDIYVVVSERGTDLNAWVYDTNEAATEQFVSETSRDDVAMAAMYPLQFGGFTEAPVEQATETVACVDCEGDGECGTCGGTGRVGATVPAARAEGEK